VTAALRWVQENIETFGGNPSQVTLMGHGVGAALVNLLAISPVVTGLFCFNDINITAMQLYQVAVTFYTVQCKYCT